MRKLALRLEDLSVTSFEADSARGLRRGTVRGRDTPFQQEFEPVNLPHTAVPNTAPDGCQETTEPEWCFETTELDWCAAQTEPVWCRWPTEQIGCRTSLC